MTVKDFPMDAISNRESGVTGVLADISANPKVEVPSNPSRSVNAMANPGMFASLILRGMNSLMCSKAL